ncbi:hypothetical protein BDK51DRAFT_38551 [Blyttiomyces helicus]|uniref:Uncharacterized protein n=1 Tax=Blyttiomyces helicus TaxID=388810 RepID=A0A4P9W4N2_9FUNG|nr:hypothetical protein BDK51DRAFT_38551 [Blyttiomyces helicus]|eukprot:RKO87311.1 hypothetical protein BDK51DRAFT_38551 [Blyttiomyces helicus]
MERGGLRLTEDPIASTIPLPICTLPTLSVFMSIKICYANYCSSDIVNGLSAQTNAQRYCDACATAPGLKPVTSPVPIAIQTGTNQVPTKGASVTGVAFPTIAGGATPAVPFPTIAGGAKTTVPFPTVAPASGSAPSVAVPGSGVNPAVVSTAAAAPAPTATTAGAGVILPGQNSAGRSSTGVVALLAVGAVAMLF